MNFQKLFFPVELPVSGPREDKSQLINTDQCIRIKFKSQNFIKFCTQASLISTSLRPQIVASGAKCVPNVTAHEHYRWAAKIFWFLALFL